MSTVISIRHPTWARWACDNKDLFAQAGIEIHQPPGASPDDIKKLKDADHPIVRGYGRALLVGIPGCRLGGKTAFDAAYSRQALYRSAIQDAGKKLQELVALNPSRGFLAPPGRMNRS
jgi:hypothetical protein